MSDRRSRRSHEGCSREGNGEPARSSTLPPRSLHAEAEGPALEPQSPRSGRLGGHSHVGSARLITVPTSSPAGPR
jgi:hypothetical protein